MHDVVRRARRSRARDGGDRPAASSAHRRSARQCWPRSSPLYTRNAPRGHNPRFSVRTALSRRRSHSGVTTGRFPALAVPICVEVPRGHVVHCGVTHDPRRRHAERVGASLPWPSGRPRVRERSPAARRAHVRLQSGRLGSALGSHFGCTQPRELQSAGPRIALPMRTYQWLRRPA